MCTEQKTESNQFKLTDIQVVLRKIVNFEHFENTGAVRALEQASFDVVRSQIRFVRVRLFAAQSGPKFIILASFFNDSYGFSSILEKKRRLVSDRGQINKIFHKDWFSSKKKVTVRSAKKQKRAQHLRFPGSLLPQY